MFLPTLVPEFGTRILFLSLAALTACALAAIFAIPRLADATPVERGARPPRMSTAARTTTVLVLLALFLFQAGNMARSEEHTSELQSLMRISYAVFCLKKKKKDQQTNILNRI